ILEEEAKAAHTVGLKKTILFPFVTLGSLINFCDCFMAGGTSRKNHSEVGSSFIHFNYTPNQDKATPSMMGNVYQGILLNKNPIFLGGQGGIAGPVRINFGCTTAAGSIIRKDELKENMLILGGGFKDFSMPKKNHVYSNIKRIFNNNINYIAGLIALGQWYRHARPVFADGSLSNQLIIGLQDTLKICIDERIKRLSDFCKKLEFSKDILIKKSQEKNTAAIKIHDVAIQRLPLAKEVFKRQTANKQVDKNGEKTLTALESGIKDHGKNYVRVIKALDPADCISAESWLYEIEHKILKQIMI
ncbi:MAG: protein GlmU, partial [Desulfobacteraceae bacterium]|nr:protein GlmU [Desulfobacteraceae bacterium]